jgi:phosphatidylinositol alpha-mannosyltransferase
LRIGIVCPYSFDVPGGVQFHVRDLAEHFLDQGHEVSVLAPADDDEGPIPAYIASCGRAVPVRYNGSVARLTFGPITNNRVNRWLENGQFDVLHLHEPVTPSVSLMALWAATTEPIVATFHTAMLRSRAMHAANPLLRPSMEKIRARIAVSEEARATVRTHLGRDAYVIPNGVDVPHFERAAPDPRWVGTADAPTIAFLGRIDEPRKGLSVLTAAMPAVLDALPGTRLIVAGPGDIEEAARALPERVLRRTEFLGAVSEPDKAGLLSAADVYVAPHTGGESFGIVLVEAMAAGAPVLASDLRAFVAVLGDPCAGVTFPNGDDAALAGTLIAMLRDAPWRQRLSRAGSERARSFDWSSVAARIMAVYQTAIDGAELEPEEPGPTGRLGRMLRRTRGGH